MPVSLQVTDPHTIPGWGEDALPGQAVTFPKPLAVRCPGKITSCLQRPRQQSRGWEAGQGQGKVTNLDRQKRPRGPLARPFQDSMMPEGVT